MAGITSKPLPRVVTPYEQTARPASAKAFQRQPLERLAEFAEVAELRRRITLLQDRVRELRANRDKWKRRAIECGGFIRSKS